MKSLSSFKMYSNDQIVATSINWKKANDEWISINHKCYNILIKEVKKKGMHMHF